MKTNANQTINISKSDSFETQAVYTLHIFSNGFYGTFIDSLEIYGIIFEK